MLNQPRDALYLLQRWYVTQCDGDWEHSYGITIDTLDNPGWRLRIDLASTPQAGVTLNSTKVERSERDWIYWWVKEDCFEAACGPTNLNEAILTFLDLMGARFP